MSENIFKANDYIEKLFVQESKALKGVRQSILQQGIDDISIAADSGKLLYLLIKMSGAKRVLEVGAFGGYSGIWMASALPADGKIRSLELNEEAVQRAKRNMQAAGYGDKITYHIGDARDSFKKLVDEGEKFDFFFIDADKENYEHYLEFAIQCATPNAIITADNVLWDGKVYDKNNQEPSTQYLRQFNERLAADKRLESMIIPSGDGLSVSRVKD